MAPFHMHVWHVRVYLTYRPGKSSEALDGPFRDRIWRGSLKTELDSRNNRDSKLSKGDDLDEAVGATPFSYLTWQKLCCVEVR